MSDPDNSGWLDAVEASSNLTRSQFLIWTGQQVDADIPLYNIAHATWLKGPLDPVRFAAAFAKLVDECDILRTVIHDHDSSPRQHVLPSIEGGYESFDLSDDTDPEQAARAWVRQRVRQRLDLSVRLFDCALIKLGHEDHVWFLNQHHLVTDASTFRLLGQRLIALLGAEPDSPLPSYADYVERERQQRALPAFERVRDYWAQQLTQPPVPTDFYGVSPKVPGPRTHRVRYALGVDRTEAIKALANTDAARMLNQELSQLRVIAALVFSFISRVSGPGRLALGCPVHNRATAEDKETPGLFIELFPLWTNIKPGQRFSEVLEGLGRDLMAWLAHARPGASTAASNTAYDVVLNFLTARMPAFPGLDTRTDWVHSGFGDRAHKLRMQVHDFDDQGEWCVDFDFNLDVFDPAAQKLVVRQFLLLLDAILADPESVIDRIDVADQEEQHQQLLTFNDTAQTVETKSFPERFWCQVDRTPNATAVVAGTVSLSYEALARQVTALATKLEQAGVEANTVVVVELDRSVEAVVALLACLELGAAYLPLDPAHPVARRKHILADLAASDLAVSALVTAEGELDELDSGLPRVEARLDTGAEPAAPRVAPAPDALAYLIYTSGSTGRPKGVPIHHGALINYLEWAARHYASDGPVTAALHSSLAVDLTITSLFLPLITGGSVVVYADTGPADLPILRVMEEDVVNFVKLTPAHLALVREAGGRSRHIRTLVLGGEELRVDLCRSVLPLFPDGLRLFNEYGPTEATVGCMIHRFDPQSDSGVSVPIGSPINNARVYVLDRDGKPVATGLRGEIAIGGAGVTRGYLNQPGLNEEKFMANSLVSGDRLYRTGDLGRWTPGGQLAFLGRDDEQVKIRGVRIELGDIESALRAISGVDAAICRVLDPARQVRIRECTRCGMPSNYPGMSYDNGGVCSLCRAWERFGAEAEQFFATEEDLRRLVQDVRADAHGAHDAIVLVSGGKDSTYMLHQLAALDLRLLAVTLDTGYLSEQALENARRSAKDLDIELVTLSTPHMNAIFADSLGRHSNVCHGCFKTIYTLALKEARDRGIKAIFTGLSRGQIFETRLDDMFRERQFDVPVIEQSIMDARKVYHRIDDAVARLLDTGLFDDDRALDEVQFIDFYRYVDVPLDEVYRYLEHRAPWVRPSDTGRSTNCLINDAGIFVHKRERGFHNYALPYSWDVRLGHKLREAALYELDDEIDTRRVRKILDEVGYTEKPARDQNRLVAYYLAAQPLAPALLREKLAAQLPEEMVPTHFVHLAEMPVAVSGKIDRAALPPPTEHATSTAPFVAPASEVEHGVAEIWSELLEEARIGVHDNFFDIGGRSLTAIQVAARLREAFSVELPMERFFEAPTVAALADAIEGELMVQIDSMSDEEVAQLLGDGVE